MRCPGGENLGLEEVYGQRHQVFFARQEGPDHCRVRAAPSAASGRCHHCVANVRQEPIGQLDGAARGQRAGTSRREVTNSIMGGT